MSDAFEGAADSDSDADSVSAPSLCVLSLSDGPSGVTASEGGAQPPGGVFDSDDSGECSEESLSDSFEESLSDASSASSPWSELDVVECMESRDRGMRMTVRKIPEMQNPATVGSPRMRIHVVESHPAREVQYAQTHPKTGSPLMTMNSAESNDLEIPTNQTLSTVVEAAVQMQMQLLADSDNPQMTYPRLRNRRT